MAEQTPERPGLRGLSSEVVMVSEPNGPRAEALRALRTHIVAQHVKLGRRALAVCAPSGGVGCSFVAANLAVALSQIGLKTLLVDGDLRAPSVGTFIVPTGEPQGLRQCLSAGEPLGAYLHSANAPDDLAVLFAGGAAANAQELIGGERFKALMEGCLRDFDITLVDTPPANLCADARRIASVLGYSLVVARRNVSLVHDVKTLVGELEVDRVEVVGTVLNEA
jgi:capsular exopolysaccharide synthesis family protein